MVKVLLKVGQPGQIPLPVTGSVVIQAANEDIRGRGRKWERETVNLCTVQTKITWTAHELVIRVYSLAPRPFWSDKEESGENLAQSVLSAGMLSLVLMRE